MNNLYFTNHRTLLLLSFVLAFKINAEDNKQKEDDIQYSETHAFSREENIKNFQENYNKIKQHILKKIVEDSSKGNEGIKEELDSFETIETILKQSNYYKDISERDMLFNNVILNKILFGLNYKGNIFLDDLFEEYQSSKAEEFITSLSFMTKNNWEEKVKNITDIADYMQKHKTEKEEIENIYKNFKEDENELIKIFSEKLAVDRYDINDYNIFVDFYKKKIALKTPLLTSKLFRTLFLAVVLILIILIVKKRIYDFLTDFNGGKYVYGKQGGGLLSSLVKKKNKEAGKKYNEAYLKLLQNISVTRKKEVIYSFINELKFFIQIFLQNKISTVSIIFKTTFFYGIVNIIVFVFKLICYFMGSIIAKVCLTEVFEPLWIKKNNIIFRKFHIITRFIKATHRLYMLCNGDNSLKRFLNKDLLNIRDIFETQDGNLRDVIECAINSPKEMSTINPISIYKVSRFICKFDAIRNRFKEAIIEFILFKNHFNALKHIIQEPSSGQWAIPSIIMNGKKGISINDFFNPMLAPKNNIGNNICFNENCQGIFLFGTNGGGKTQLELSLGVFFMFLNGYGIGPCKKARLSTVDYIYFVQDITTDTSKNFSKFKNEIFTCLDFFYYKNKIVDFYKKYKKCSTPLFVNIIDELLEGTSFDESTKALRNYLLNLLKDSDVFLLFAHHNPQLTKIAKNYPKLKCVNAYMGYNNTKNGLEYTYKLTQGLPKESIVESVVKKMYREGLIYNPKYILTSLV